MSAPLADCQAAPIAAVPAATQMTDGAGNYPIAPSQAAMIAQQAYPGSKVLGVKLLPSGEYAVTLKVGGSVQRVMVNATSGATG
ncbi:MAG: PepSY domain-containing protein [Alphaproteobacteria bacterium]|nr:PepSY domain-containing protein [Alphaproteobacteria bacterium]